MQFVSDGSQITPAQNGRQISQMFRSDRERYIRQYGRIADAQQARGFDTVVDLQAPDREAQGLTRMAAEPVGSPLLAP